MQTPLAEAAICAEITYRPYQMEALRQVCEAFEQGKIVHIFERLRAQQQEASWQGEPLFQALLRQAFQGEL